MKIMQSNKLNDTKYSQFKVELIWASFESAWMSIQKWEAENFIYDQSELYGSFEAN